ncbi:unnamed protein product [Rotaria socialis]|uniref:Uncharacterized protein n=1 Tax=Rotaria socialis TaxID=392032 RepID=A0A817N1S9_9BILA|nr:unnamed protein product [Rotaria socialis]CAF3642919.1 unnamed protein product [Rotaria socialis]CAF4474230.1 unnamed protein product [Rotaria socialis]CAF4540119.1 unnamed protein product [Rotaria socialis]CAF4829425.1 unnamed protein product [Rotaria socialis]
MELLEKIRLVTRDVFLTDTRFEHTNCISTNRDARVFLQHILARARHPEFNLHISISQISRLTGSRRRRDFVEWFYLHAPRHREFRRVQWFLNEMIRVNAVEHLREVKHMTSDAEYQQFTINADSPKMPTVEQMNYWHCRTAEIQENMRSEGPRIERLESATETLENIQNAIFELNSDGTFDPSSSLEDSDSDSDIGKSPIEEKCAQYEMFESELYGAILGKFFKDFYHD